MAYQQRIRETKEMTTLIILKELARDPTLRASRLSERLGISIQAASDYLKELQMKDFIRRETAGYRLTERGVLRLQQGIEDLREFLLEAVSSINTVDETEAIAARELKAGEVVNLSMRAGFLTAGGEEYMGSQGVVVDEASPGELVRLKDLKGILKHSPGRILMVSLTRTSFDTEALGNLSRRISESFREALLIPLDERGEVFIRRLKELYPGGELQILPPVGVPYLALVKGIDAVLVGCPRSIKNSTRFIQWAEKELTITFTTEELLI